MSQISSLRATGRRSVPRAVVLLGLFQAAAFGVALPTMQGAPAQAQEARKVSLDFVGADVHTVAKALSIQSGVNVVVMPSITGKVTIRLTRCRWKMRSGAWRPPSGRTSA
jgi:type II secretory pathway component HofQ